MTTELAQEIQQLGILLNKFRNGHIHEYMIQDWIHNENQRTRVTDPDQLIQSINELNAEVQRRREPMHQNGVSAATDQMPMEVKLVRLDPPALEEDQTTILALPPVAQLKPPAEYEMINILLLGETGTGKSTFINAFANYLAFASFQQAHDGDPIVLIPVSFILTSGHQFNEQIITFGECDSSNNEHFNKHGQSATQQCRSYDFDLPQHQGRRVCIIDTPGFGDTRGIDQDDRNIDHIRQYITRWTHLHAVCFLLKPNESRLSISFRRCFNQLFSLLGPKVGANVLFCFTNARSTFYAPGNTAPLLKKMLTAVEGSRVEMKKENTFCFDSESFRYLMAVQNGVTFREEEKSEYEKSWITSVKEANRLIDRARQKLPFTLDLNGRV